MFYNLICAVLLKTCLKCDIIADTKLKGVIKMLKGVIFDKGRTNIDTEKLAMGGL